MILKQSHFSAYRYVELTLFISFSSRDDEFVRELRLALESQGISVWFDSNNLRGGGVLAPEVSLAIEQAHQVIVVLSLNTINSPSVLRELQKAKLVERQHQDKGYKIIPLLLPSIEPKALELWFDGKSRTNPIQCKTGSVNQVLHDLLKTVGSVSLRY